MATRGRDFGLRRAGLEVSDDLLAGVAVAHDHGVNVFGHDCARPHLISAFLDGFGEAVRDALDLGGMGRSAGADRTPAVPHSSSRVCYSDSSILTGLGASSGRRMNIWADGAKRVFHTILAVVYDFVG